MSPGKHLSRLVYYTDLTADSKLYVASCGCYTVFDSSTIGERIYLMSELIFDFLEYKTLFEVSTIL